MCASLYLLLNLFVYFTVLLRRYSVRHGVLAAAAGTQSGSWKIDLNEGAKEICA